MLNFQFSVDNFETHIDSTNWLASITFPEGIQLAHKLNSSAEITKLFVEFCVIQ